ncbi:methyl-accepting chemotaxis sensory transducer [[Bacillus] selenitireducens MLS10]|uniref:Methyl-accepting chemotaxis sensory transducer n=2 Tax=Salisediminibacterium selenitireducens TaxID=85683 RepID=D6XT82_BACIE|nr:methyl-accepting chemotaxis sensory transducer [[Bacillus] selenitireducens MLS10]
MVRTLYGLIAVIVMVSLSAGAIILHYSSQVQEQSQSMEETSQFQDQYTELVMTIKQIGLLNYQLVTDGYSEDQINELDRLLTEADSHYISLVNDADEQGEIRHYLDFIEDSLTAYRQLYDDHFSTIYVGDEVERIRSRVVPVITRTEVSLANVDDRIQNQLTDNRENAAGNLEAALQTTNTMTIGAITVLLFVPLVSLILFATSFRNGFRHVLERINAYDNGDLSFEHSHERTDEFGHVDKRLGHMGDTLNKLFKVNEEVGAKVYELTDAADRMSHEQIRGMDHISASMTQFTKQTASQSEFVSSVSATTEQVSAGSQEIRSSIEQMNARMTQVNQVTENGRETMLSLQELVKRLIKEAETAKTDVGQMKEKLEHMSKFLEGIDGIADQTNLLAINASIEAAKAGKEGRSFAVVADEIRKLSQGTNDFSKQSAEVVKELNRDTDQVFQSFGSLTERMRETGERSEKTTELFTDIALSNRSASKDQADIEESIAQINEAIEEVVEAVTELADSAVELESRTKEVDQEVTVQQERQTLLNDQVRTITEESAKLKSGL